MVFIFIAYYKNPEALTNFLQYAMAVRSNKLNTLRVLVLGCTGKLGETIAKFALEFRFWPGWPGPYDNR